MGEEQVPQDVVQFMPPFERTMFGILGNQRFVKFMQDRDRVCDQYRRGMITEQEFLVKQAELLADFWLELRNQQHMGGIVERGT